MRICKCSGCVQLVHFDEDKQKKTQRKLCWNCHTSVTLPVQKHSVERALDSLINEKFGCFAFDLMHATRWKKIVLMAALPTAVVMLLMCNGFDIYMVENAMAPFRTSTFTSFVW